MDADKRRSELDKLTETVIGCAYKVANTLGPGFLGKVYENALALELRQTKLTIQQQAPIKVHYEGTVVGDFVADMIVQDLVLVELKAVRALDENHMAQCLNYLKATGLNVCLLLNFGHPRIEIKRIVNNY